MPPFSLFFKLLLSFQIQLSPPGNLENDQEQWLPRRGGVIETEVIVQLLIAQCDKAPPGFQLDGFFLKMRMCLFAKLLESFE